MRVHCRLLSKSAPRTISVRSQSILTSKSHGSHTDSHWEFFRVGTQGQDTCIQVHTLCGLLGTTSLQAAFTASPSDRLAGVSWTSEPQPPPAHVRTTKPTAPLGLFLTSALTWALFKQHLIKVGGHVRGSFRNMTSSPRKSVLLQSSLPSLTWPWLSGAVSHLNPCSQAPLTQNAPQLNSLKTSGMSAMAYPVKHPPQL